MQPQRPRPARLRTPELKQYVELTLPHALVMNREGTVWAVNRLFQPLARRSKSDPNRWVPPHYPGAPPQPAGPGLTIVALWQDHKPPWADYQTLHAIENLWALWQPLSIGKPVCAATAQEKNRTNQPTRAAAATPEPVETAA